MHEVFFEAFAHAPVRHRVLGRKLQPLSIWHETLLDVADSPFALKKRPESWKPPKGKEARFKALLIAVEICTRTPFRLPVDRGIIAHWRRRRAFRKFYRGGIFQRSALLPRRLRGAGRVSGGDRTSSETLIALQEISFLAYLSDFRQLPVFGSTPESRPLNTPRWLYEASLYIRFHPNVSEKEAWSMGPGKIVWANAAMLEAHGIEVLLMTEERMAALERAKKKALRKQARKAAKTKP